MNFTLAVQRNMKNDKGEYESDFINCVAWNGSADYISRYLTKGSLIGVEGRITTRHYDAPDGRKYVTEVNVESVSSLEKKSDDVVKGKVNGGTFDIPVEPNNELIIEDKDLPFY